MPVLSIHPRLRQELRQARQNLFLRWRWSLHLLLWGIVSAALIGVNQEILGNRFSSYFNTSLVSAAGYIYTFLLLILPYARYKRSVALLTCFSIMNVIIWWAVLFMMRRHLYHTHPEIFPAQLLAQPGLILGVSLGSLLALVWSFLSCYYFLDLYDKQQNLAHYETVLSEKLKAEMAFLQSQINPHFLFNTLNNIYLLTLKQRPDAAIITRRLKELLHYMLYDCTQDKVPLSGEILFLKNYIALEELRNRQESVNISLQTNGDTEGLEIAPLLLINFVENAFKHGVKAGIGIADVDIRLDISRNELIFYISNTLPDVIPATEKLGISASGGIGIGNVRRRLQVIYPDRHELKITEGDGRYIVQLHITL
ncbi:sensor histidine kinase [Chitinophagaceae bacterium MMS25-I14]